MAKRRLGKPAKSSKAGIHYWRLRLLRRRPPTSRQPDLDEEYSVRIEQGGTSQYFLLGSLDENAAAAKASDIYQTIENSGWNVVRQRFARELTLGFHWVANPVAWTYTTIHTRLERVEANPAHARNQPLWNLAIIESDPGVRQAIVWHLRHHQPFLRAATFTNAKEALREIPKRPVQFTLSNHSLPDMSGDSLLEKLSVLAPRSPGLIYSVYEDSDQLFRATPGGASGYLLKRTSPEQMLEPIRQLLSKGPVTPQQILQQVRQYFRDITTLLQSSDEVLEMGKLTPREKEILGYLSKGYLDKEIAHTLGISVWTVHGHLKNIFEKLQVHSRTEAVVKFLQK